MAKVSALNERTKKTIPIKKLVYTGMMTAITVVTSQIAFPLPSGIPVTLQTFSVSFCGYFGGFWGVAAVGVYLLLGLVGVPVFANFKGGFSAFSRQNYDKNPKKHQISSVFIYFLKIQTSIVRPS